jgi:hypothetical protein
MLDYTGNTFTETAVRGTPPDAYTTTDFIAGWIALPDMLAPNLVDQPIVPLSFSFSDGVNTLTPANVNFTVFNFWTDAFGMPSSWTVFMRGVFPTDSSGTDQRIVTQKTADLTVDVGISIYRGEPPYNTQAGNGDNPGTWTYKKNGVPLPSTLVLYALGLLAMRRRITVSPEPRRVRAFLCLTDVGVDYPAG